MLGPLKEFLKEAWKLGGRFPSDDTVKDVAHTWLRTRPKTLRRWDQKVREPLHNVR